MTRRSLLLITAVSALLWFGIASAVGAILIAARRASADDIVSALLCAAMCGVIAAGLLFGRRRRPAERVLEPLGSYRAEGDLRAEER